MEIYLLSDPAFKTNGASIQPAPLGFGLLFPEVPLEQPSESLAVPGLVPCHLMHGIMNGVQVQGLGALGQVGLAGGLLLRNYHLSGFFDRLISLIL